MPMNTNWNHASNPRSLMMRGRIERSRMVTAATRSVVRLFGRALVRIAGRCKAVPCEKPRLFKPIRI